MGEIKEIEKIQKRATKLIINLQNMSYTNMASTSKLNIPTLKYRRLWGDTISRPTSPELEIDQCMKYVVHSFSHRAACNADAV